MCSLQFNWKEELSLFKTTIWLHSDIWDLHILLTCYVCYQYLLYMQTYAQVTIRALATSQNGAKQSSVVTRTFTVHKAEEGSDVDTASITSEGEQTVSEIDEYLRLVPRPLPDSILHGEILKIL